MLVGIVLRGSAFTFRTYDTQRDAVQRRWGRIFAGASVVTPVLLGVSRRRGRVGRVGPVDPRAGFAASFVEPVAHAVRVRRRADGARPVRLPGRGLSHARDRRPAADRRLPRPRALGRASRCSSRRPSARSSSRRSRRRWWASASWGRPGRCPFTWPPVRRPSRYSAALWWRRYHLARVAVGHRSRSSSGVGLGAVSLSRAARSHGRRQRPRPTVTLRLVTRSPSAAGGGGPAAVARGTCSGLQDGRRPTRAAVCPRRPRVMMDIRVRTERLELAPLDARRDRCADRRRRRPPPRADRRPLPPSGRAAALHGRPLPEVRERLRARPDEAPWWNWLMFERETMRAVGLGGVRRPARRGRRGADRLRDVRAVRGPRIRHRSGQGDDRVGVRSRVCGRCARWRRSGTRRRSAWPRRSGMRPVPSDEDDEVGEVLVYAVRVAAMHPLRIGLISSASTSAVTEGGRGDDGEQRRQRHRLVEAGRHSRQVVSHRQRQEPDAHHQARDPDRRQLAHRAQADRTQAQLPQRLQQVATRPATWGSPARRRPRPSAAPIMTAKPSPSSTSAMANLAGLDGLRRPSRIQSDREDRSEQDDEHRRERLVPARREAVPSTALCVLRSANRLSVEPACS